MPLWKVGWILYTLALYGNPPVRPSHFFLSVRHILAFFFESTWSIATKLWQNSYWVVLFQNYSLNFFKMTGMETNRLTNCKYVDFLYTAELILTSHAVWFTPNIFPGCLLPTVCPNLGRYFSKPSVGQNWFWMYAV